MSLSESKSKPVRDAGNEENSRINDGYKMNFKQTIALVKWT